MSINTNFELLPLDTLYVLRDTYLDNIRKVSETGHSHSINGRSVTTETLSTFVNELAGIERAILIKTRKRSKVSYASFRHSNRTW